MAFNYSLEEYEKDQLIAHANKAGTAHDWQAPGHGGIRIGNMGEVNPHGRRGSNTWSDGRIKVPVEDLKKRNNELRKELGMTEAEWIRDYGNTGGSQISTGKRKIKKTKRA